MIDLHTHTNASDGDLTPEMLIIRASQLGLRAIAITDHDTLAGIEEAADAGERFGVSVIPGVELSVSSDYVPEDSSHWMHMLVYYPPENGHLAREFIAVRKWRQERNVLILERLRDLGLEISMPDVMAYAKGDVVGRPHFADALVNKGMVAHRGEAFYKYLGKGKPAYVEREKLSAQKAIELALLDGAVPVLAHPESLGLQADELFDCLEDLKRFGLCGVEALYPRHDEAFTLMLLEYAERLGLIVTGGSDFHRPSNQGLKLGRAGQQFRKLPESVLSELAACRRKLKSAL